MRCVYGCNLLLDTRVLVGNSEIRCQRLIHSCSTYTATKRIRWIRSCVGYLRCWCWCICGLCLLCCLACLACVSDHTKDRDDRCSNANHDPFLFLVRSSAYFFKNSHLKSSNRIS